MQVKQRLIVPLLLATVAAAVYSAIRFWLTGGSIAWFGAVLACAVLPLYFAAFVAVGGAARTASRLPVLQLGAAAGVALAAFGGFRDYASGQSVAFVPLAAALLGVAVLEWYVFVYSRYGREASRFIVRGERLPALEFETLDGELVTLPDLYGSKTLIVFFRGNWCPLCMAQLRELSKRADRLAAASVQVRFVSNQSVEKSRELAGKLRVPDHFEILHDRDLRVARALSIEDIGGAPPGMADYPADTVMATVIALDAEGRVVFGDETDNYRVRPHPDDFIPVFED